jgi:lipopolysaccharide/colanic/teichoic acid biosynthesis glycosyltransferase
VLDDLDGRKKELRVPEQQAATPRSDHSDFGFVAPITIDQPGWRRRYRQCVFAVDAAAVGCSSVLYLLWQHVVAAPAMAVGLSVAGLSIVGRAGLSGWLHHLRTRGRALSTILAVGSVDDVAALVARTRRFPALGWRVAGACTSTGAGPDGAADISGVPVIGDLDTVGALALAGRFDAIAVTPAAGWTSVRLQQLADDLNVSSAALLVDPRLIRTSGRRVRITSVDGLRLRRLDYPTLTGPRRAAKDVIDRLGALLLLVVLSPIMLSCALAVRRDGGPSLSRRRCRGRGGREFSLLSFRATSGATGSVGRTLRRYSLHELPQLLNVIGGSMALVGPRPVRLSDSDGHIAPPRLLVKPGLTGLWHIDRAQDVSQTELELHYVERWTPALDVRILLNTLAAVFRRSGPR